MIKYLGSKRRLVPVLGDLLSRSGARTALCMSEASAQAEAQVVWHPLGTVML